MARDVASRREKGRCASVSILSKGGRYLTRSFEQCPQPGRTAGPTSSQLPVPVFVSYDLRLVALSVLIASIASYGALDLAGRTTAAAGRARIGWLLGGSLVLGIGIWSMHFIGML